MIKCILGFNGEGQGEHKSSWGERGGAPRPGLDVNVDQVDDDVDQVGVDVDQVDVNFDQADQNRFPGGSPLLFCTQGSNLARFSRSGNLLTN